ncbi:unnamed protein product [Linum trigynum]|uniref:Clathrin light chain n=1 Tax=Linum trigynum TaxID=586398 RepID=A0AAV2G8H2_9ROSI
MDVQEVMLEHEKEEWAHKWQVREREAEKWIVEKKEREAQILHENMEEFIKANTEKKKFWRSKQNDILGYDQYDPNSNPSDGGDGGSDYYPVMDY